MPKYNLIIYTLRTAREVLTNPFLIVPVVLSVLYYLFRDHIKETLRQGYRAFKNWIASFYDHHEKKVEAESRHNLLLLKQSSKALHDAHKTL